MFDIIIERAAMNEENDYSESARVFIAEFARAMSGKFDYKTEKAAVASQVKFAPQTMGRWEEKAEKAEPIERISWKNLMKAIEVAGPEILLKTGMLRTDDNSLKALFEAMPPESLKRVKRRLEDAIEGK